MIKGVTKFDGVAVGEFTAVFLGPTLEFKAKAAFVDSKTGETHGWTTNSTWSPPTIAKLKELREMMELDLGMKHLESGGELTANTVTAQRGGAQPPTGLGDHLGESGAEQV
jgi:hypothetical protein